VNLLRGVDAGSFDNISLLVKYCLNKTKMIGNECTAVNSVFITAFEIFCSTFTLLWNHMLVKRTVVAALVSGKNMCHSRNWLASEQLVF
jgi:hypothetical protein